MKSRFNGTHKSVPVVMIEVNGETMSFNSISECALYVKKELGIKGLYPETIARKIVDGSSWNYEEVYFLRDGRKIVEVHEFYFDELEDGSRAKMITKGNVTVRHNKRSTAKKETIKKDKTSTVQSQQLEFNF